MQPCIRNFDKKEKNFIIFSRPHQRKRAFRVAFLQQACYNVAMKNRNSQPTKSYKIVFSNLIIGLCILVFALCVSGIAVSVYRLVKFGVETWSDALKSPLLIGVSVFCIALVISVLVRSRYLVDGKYLISQFGFVKSKFEIKDITTLELNTDTYKLTVYMGEQFFVITSSPAWNEEFIRALLAVNPNIDYTFTLASKEEPKKKK